MNITALFILLFSGEGRDDPSIVSQIFEYGFWLWIFLFFVIFAFLSAYGPKIIKNIKHEAREHFAKFTGW